MVDIVTEFQRQFFSKYRIETPEEANAFLSLQTYFRKGLIGGGVVGSGLTWIATRRLLRFNRMGLGKAIPRLIRDSRICLSLGAVIITGPWGVEISLNSWIDHVLAMEGSRIQKELESVIVQKFPHNRRMRVQPRRWYWNFRGDNAAFSQITPDSDNHSDSDSKQNDLESKQVPMDTRADPDSSGGGIRSGRPKN